MNNLSIDNTVWRAEFVAATCGRAFHKDGGTGGQPEQGPARAPKEPGPVQQAPARPEGECGPEGRPGGEDCHAGEEIPQCPEGIHIAARSQRETGARIAAQG